MAGSSNITGLESVIFADNASYDGTERGGIMTTNGQLWIGSTASPHVKLGTITSPDSSITVGYSGPNITLMASGSAVLERLTPDTGGVVTPIGGNINVLGVQANTTPVMQTRKVGSDFKIEDRSWYSQYVVDPSTTVGLQGTFSTIQSAINQAVTDGMTLTTPALIYLRLGTYTENLSIPAGVVLIGESPQGDAGQIITTTTVSGTHTFADTATLFARNVSFTSGGTMFTGGATVFILELQTCELINTGAGPFVNSSAAGINNLFMRGCFCDTGGIINGFTMHLLTISRVDDCQFNGAGFNISGGALRSNNCQNIGPVVFNSGTLRGINCTFSSDNTDCITGTASQGVLEKCGFSSNSGTNGVNITGSNWDLVDCYIHPTSTGPVNLFAKGNVSLAYSQEGDILTAVRSAVSYNAAGGEAYIGITSTAAARTVVLPTAASTPLDYAPVIADESGAAATNHITVSVSGGATINGAATLVISKNYGAAKLHFDGANYQVTTNNSSTSSFPFTDEGGSFSALSNNGYFISAGATATLPASPVQGDVIVLINDGAGTVIAQAVGTQVIRIGSAVSSAAGTATSTIRGDTLYLTYRASGTAWISTSTTGTWVTA